MEDLRKKTTLLGWTFIEHSNKALRNKAHALWII